MVIENIFYLEEKKNGEGIRGKYRFAEKEKKGREREENIWRRRIFFWKRKKMSKIFGEGFFSFWRIQEKEENIVLQRRQEKRRKKRKENLSEKENFTVGGQTDRQTNIVKIVLEF